jgi:hypothetical protein
LRGGIADEVRLIELVMSGLESRSEAGSGNFERRIAARWNPMNAKEAGAKVPLQ